MGGVLLFFSSFLLVFWEGGGGEGEKRREEKKKKREEKRVGSGAWGSRGGFFMFVGGAERGEGGISRLSFSGLVFRILSMRVLTRVRVRFQTWVALRWVETLLIKARKTASRNRFEGTLPMMQEMGSVCPGSRLSVEEGF